MTTNLNEEEINKLIKEKSKEDKMAALKEAKKKFLEEKQNPTLIKMALLSLSDILELDKKEVEEEVFK